LRINAGVLGNRALFVAGPAVNVTAFGQYF